MVLVRQTLPLSSLYLILIDSTFWLSTFCGHIKLILSNEEQVGQAVSQSSVPRSSVFLTTKLGHADDIPNRLHQSVDLLDPSKEGSHVDLFLIHSPSAGPEKRKEQWGEMEKLVEEGKAKAIGVSN